MATKTASRAKPRATPSRDRLPSTPDPIEIAMVAAASGKPLPDAARAVLEKHAKLIDRQAELAHAQCGELKLRRVGEGVRAALWAILAIAALAVVGLVAAVVVRASRSDALVVQSFRVPPALEARGLSGEVVATQVLDKLAEMQARTNSVRAPSTYANNWEDELKIDIPNTGTSTNEVWKLLRGWLGKETRISGEVVDTGAGLALTARVGSSPGRRFVNATGDLDSLIKDGAELIYRQTQPYRFAVYVARDGREVERHPILKQLTAHDSPTERKWAYSGLSFDFNGRGLFRQSVRMAQRALAIDPQMAPALSNGALAHGRLGHDQLALDMYSKALTLMDNPEYEPKVRAVNICGLYPDLGYYLRDPTYFDRAGACFESLEGLDVIAASTERANAALMRHDAAPALALRADPQAGLSAEEALRFNALYHLMGQVVRGRPAELAEALEKFRSVAQLPPSIGFAALHYRAAAPTQDWPLEAETLLAFGRNAEAAALISKTPRDCYNCVRVRGLVAQALGDAPGAQRWFAEAVRQGPRLPAAYVDWGRLLARHRRWASAEKRLARAAELSPNWADPLKFWGDALAAQGKRAEARVKYDAALKLAPKWGDLRRARARLART